MSSCNYMFMIVLISGYLRYDFLADSDYMIFILKTKGGTSDFHDYYDYDDASSHIRAFMQCIDEWCDPPIYEDVLMQLFVMTLCEELALLSPISRDN